MNKFKKIALFSLSALSVLVVSCDKVDNNDGEEYSKLNPTANVSGIVNWTGATTLTVDEANEDSYTYTVTIDKPQVVPVEINIIKVSGSATLGEDIDFDEHITIPAYATSATGTVHILDDCTIEGVEDITLRISDVRTANANIPAKDIKFTINNNFSPVNTTLDLEFAFNKTVTFNGAQVALCAATVAYDMDFYITDSAFNDMGYYDAAALGCPEAISLSTDPTAANYLADGTYYVFYDIADTGNLNGGTNTATDGFENYYHEPFDIPVTVNYSRCGSLDPGVFMQESKYYASSTSAANIIDTSFGPASTYVVTIEVNAGVFTLKNSVPTVIATGKTGKPKFNLATARRNNPNRK
jgi:hypothetical protein